MGRELRRKQAKKDGKNVREVQKLNKEKPISQKTFWIIIISLVLSFIVLYILTGLFITKEIKWFEKDNDTVETNSNVKNKILAVDTLSQNENTYYVYYFNSKEEKSTISSLVSSIEEKVYRVDLNDAFNSNFVGTPSGVTQDINNLKVTNPTLVKIENRQMTSFVNGEKEITESLK